MDIEALAEKTGFLVEDITHRTFEDRMSLTLEAHLKNNFINLASIPLYGLDLKSTKMRLSNLLKNPMDLSCQYQITGSEDNKWNAPIAEGIEYSGDEYHDFNHLRPDFLYRDNNSVTIIECKLGATQSWQYNSELRPKCDQYARYADWLISAKANCKEKKKNLIILTSQDLISNPENKIPKEILEALQFNNRLNFVNGYFIIWEDIFNSFTTT